MHILYFPSSMKSVEEKRAYALGIINGIWSYAWQRDGITYVGNNGYLYSDAVTAIKNSFTNQTGEVLHWIDHE